MTTIIGQDAGWQISKVSASADDILAGISVGTSTTDQTGVYAYQLSSYYSNTHYQDDHFRHADGHSKIIGFTFDGYPFYGPYGYDLSMNMESTVVMMTSSYALRSEEQYYVYENGTVVSDVGYNQPAVSTTTYYRVPYTSSGVNPTTDGIYFDAYDNVIALYNGGFIQDYKYNPGTGHLDESNGRYCKTPDYPNGTYAYFLTSTYPCTMGNRPRNNLDTDNTSVKQVKTTRNNRDLSLNTFNSDTNIPITDDVINNIALSSITMAFDASYGVGYTHFWMSTDSSGNAVMNIKTDGDPYPMIAGVTSYTNEVARDGFGGGNAIGTGEWKNSTMNYYGGLTEANSPITTATKTNDIYFPFSSVGVFVNGAAMYTQNAGSTVPPYGGSGADVNAPTGFYFDPAAFGDRYGIDEAAGHPTPGGEYHNHDILFLYTETMLGIPDAPTDVVAVSGNASAKIYFTLPYDGGSAITSYRVDGDGTYYGSGTSSPITLTGLTNGTIYSFYVRAINENGTSDNSTTVSVDVGTPTAPNSVTATPGNEVITVSFSAPDSSGGAIITRYFVYDTTGNIDASGTTSPIVVRGLTNGQSYSYYVAARNIYGTGTSSSTVTAIAGTPGIPTNVSALASDSTIDITFTTPSSNGGSTITNYIVYDEDGNIDASGLDSPIRVSGLTNGQSYSYYVAAENANGIGSNSSTVSATPVSTTTVPGAPTNVSAVAGDTYIDISFTAPSSNGGSTITNYIVYDTTGNIDASGLDSPIRVSGLTNGQSYSYYVAAENANGIGSNSSTVSATPVSTTTVPGAPTNVTAFTDNATIILYFSEPNSNGGSPIIKYIVYDTSGNIDASGLDSPIRVSGLTNGQSYSYYVAAENATGIGAYSSTVSGIPYTVPGTPTNVFTNAGNSTIDIYFTAPSSNGGSPITNYIVYDTSGNIDASGLYSPIRVSELTNGNTYYFKIAAVSIIGIGSYSSIVSGIPYSVPSEPTSVYTVAGNGYIDVYFSAPTSNGGSSISNYIVYDTTGNIDASGLYSPIHISGLTNGQTYSYYVAAKNANGIGSYSSIVSDIPYTVPGAPTSVYTFAGNSYIDIYFTAPTSNGGSPITNYIVYDTSGNIDASGLDSPIRVSGLTNGETYSYYVTAKNASGIGPYSSAVSATPYTIPGAPRNAIAISGNSFIDVSFSAPSSNGGSPITNYIVYDTSGNIDASGSSSPIRISGLTNGQTYSYYVAAKNASGIGPYSNEVYAFPYTVPGAPSILNVSSSNQSLTVSFSPPTYNGSSDILSYIAYAKYSGITTTGTGSSSSSSITISGLINGSRYVVSVSAINNAGTGASSSIIYAVPFTVPDAPTIISSSAGDSYINIQFSAPSWNGGSTITGYIVVDSNDNEYASGTSSPLVVSGLTNGTTYTFYVKASNIAGSGARSDAITTYPYTLPYAPTDITTSVGDGYIDVSFSAPTETGGYPIIYYNITDNDTIDVSGTSSPIRMSGLTKAVEYTFYIKAYNQYGPGSSTSFIGILYAVPDAPSINSAISENATGRIYFTVPNNNGSEITSYCIVDSDGTQYSTNNSTKSPIIIYNLTNGTSYTFYLIAVNAAGTSANSSSFNINPYTTPSAPTITNTVSGNNYIDISFSEPTSNGGIPITQYNIINSPGNKVTTGTTSPIRVSNLVNGTNYTFKIAAKNSAGIGSYSTDVSAISYTTPDAPTITKINAWNSSVDIYFSPPENNGGLSITSYNVYDTTNNLTRTGFISSPITLSNLINNTTYSFFMKAVNSAGSGTSSDVSNATPKAVPFAPTIISAGAGSNGGSANIFFDTPSDNGGFSITGYIATSNPDGIIGNSLSSPIIIQNLRKGIPYNFTVQAQNINGTGSPSTPSSVVVPIGVPDRPIITSLLAGNRSVTIGFLPPLNTGGLPILRYTAKSIPENIEVSGNVPNITVSNLNNGTSYTFILNATNALGTSQYSLPSGTVIPFTIPDPPTGIAIDNGNQRADVYYTNPMNTGGNPITGYLVRDLSNQIIKTGSASPITIDRLANGQTLVNGRNYTFSLSVVNAAGPSSTSIFNFIPMTTPNAPNIINVFTGFGYADIVFNPPSNNGGSDILYYTLYLGELEIIGYTSPIRIPDLLNGSSYMIRLSATNAAGTGSSTANYPFTMSLSVPGPPTITELVPGNGYVDIILEPPVNTGGSPIIGYSFTPTPSADYNVTQYTSTFRYSGLTNGVSYTFAIRAINEDGSSEDVVSDSVTPYTVPDAPAITNIVASDTSVTVYFDPPSFNGGSDILDYSVYYTGSDITGSSVIASSETTIYGFTNDVAYTFTMVARNAAGFSAFSESFGPITPKSEKIDYCVKQSCVKAQYSQFTTGGNDPKLTKAMRYSQLLSSRKPKTGFL